MAERRLPHSAAGYDDGDDGDEWVYDDDEPFPETRGGRGRQRSGAKKSHRGGAMRRHWTEDEDAAVLNAVFRVTGRTKWEASDGPSNAQMTEIIAAVPGRTKKQVRERWFHKLNPGISDAPWRCVLPPPRHGGQLRASACARECARSRRSSDRTPATTLLLAAAPVYSRTLATLSSPSLSSQRGRGRPHLPSAGAAGQ